MTIKSQIGLLAEGYVCEYLKKKGYNVLERNYRQPWGEVDVIAMHGQAVVFVEVKANKAEYRDFQPEIRANREKMTKVVRAARTYLAQHRLNDSEWRLDIISVVFDKSRGVVKIKHFINIDY